MGIEDLYIKVWLENLREEGELKDFGYPFEAYISKEIDMKL
jgi:hypothetical protein